ncbi:MAG TPA: CDP-alcohol phosphatidyltransferase family protein [Terriglobales bacterium]|nr:CDP-alcohol phosphatidyltransferase family protein [Terriglobales bacterium]
MSLRTWAAWGVHLYTAIGAPLALIALVASGRGYFQLAFLCMTVATFIDSTDGVLARRVGVKQVLPQIDGARLDDIVDYLNFVVVPIVVAYQAELIPSTWWGLLVASAPLVASGYGFSQADAKIEAPREDGAQTNHYFTGFPSYWNIVVFYLYAFQSSQWFNVALLLIFSLMVFVPIRYLYPSRNTVARNLTYGLGVLWALLMIVVLIQLPQPSQTLVYISLFYPIYYVGLSFALHFRTA